MPNLDKELGELYNDLEEARLADNGAWLVFLLQKAYVMGKSDGYDRGWTRAMSFVAGEHLVGALGD